MGTDPRPRGGRRPGARARGGGGDREKIANGGARTATWSFILAGMGGGTGGGASPIVAEIAAEEGALVIAFVTLPVQLRGRPAAQAGGGGPRGAAPGVRRGHPAAQRHPAAGGGRQRDRARLLCPRRRVDRPGRQVDLVHALEDGADQRGFCDAAAGLPAARGQDPLRPGRGFRARTRSPRRSPDLKLCPLLHTPEFSRKADRLLVNITGGTDLTLPKVNEIMSAIAEQFGRESHIIMGAVIDEGMQGSGRDLRAGRERHGRPGGGPAPAGSRPGAHRAGPRGGPGAQAGAGGARQQRGEPASTSRRRPRRNSALARWRAAGSSSAPTAICSTGQDLDVPTYLRKGIKIAI